MKELFNELSGYSIAIVEDMQEKEVDSWEMCISEGLTNKAMKEEAQWRLGCVAAIIEKFYESHNDRNIGNKLNVLTVFANDIGVDKVTLRRYKSVVTGNLDLCDMTLDDLKLETMPDRPYPKLTFSHLSEVVSVKDTKEKKELLDKAHDYNMTVKRLRSLAKEKSGDINNIDIEPYVKQDEKLEFLESAFIRIDHEQKVVWFHRAYDGYEIRLV